MPRDLFHAAVFTYEEVATMRMNNKSKDRLCIFELLLPVFPLLWAYIQAN